MTEDPDSDPELVDRILQAGDERAFRLLYGRHTPRLLRLAKNLVADGPGDPIEIVQDTWVRAVGRLAGFEWRSTLITWLVGILTNRVREASRARGRSEFVELTDDVGPSPDPPDIVERVELERVIASLAPGARAVLILHDIEGYTHEEIALMLSIQPGTSKSQLCRARQAVVNQMQIERRDPSHVRT